MILLVNDTETFNISLRLNINYELRYIELTVCCRNKQAGTIMLKRFDAAHFGEALDYFQAQERFFFGSNAAKSHEAV